jgi:hypothetical protein
MQVIEYSRKVMKETSQCENCLSNDKDLLAWLQQLGHDGWIPVGTPMIHDYNKGWECIFYRVVS